MLIDKQYVVMVPTLLRNYHELPGAINFGAPSRLKLFWILNIFWKFSCWRIFSLIWRATLLIWSTASAKEKKNQSVEKQGNNNYQWVKNYPLWKYIAVPQSAKAVLLALKAVAYQSRTKALNSKTWFPYQLLCSCKQQGRASHWTWKNRNATTD